MEPYSDLPEGSKEPERQFEAEPTQCQKKLPPNEKSSSTEKRQLLGYQPKKPCTHGGTEFGSIPLPKGVGSLPLDHETAAAFEQQPR